MNGLGLAAFDAAGATGWRQITLPVSVSGDVVQVDVSVTNVGDGLYDSQVIVDFVAEAQLSITADLKVACPNETLTLSALGNPTGTISWSNGGTPATGSGTQFQTRFGTTGDYSVGNPFERLEHPVCNAVHPRE